MMHPLLKPLIGFSLIIDIVLLDQISKWFVLEYLLKPRMAGLPAPMDPIGWILEPPARLPHISIEVLPFFNLGMVWNEGISFGLLEGSGPLALILMSVLISALFMVWLARSRRWVQAISLGMVIGGALSNAIDRLRFGAVADFLDFHLSGWHYPAFNVADSCITLGIAFLVFDGLFLEPKQTKEKNNPE